MHYLYVLKSAIKDRHYIGITEDTDKRLRKHNAGDVRSTKPYRPWKLLYTETYDDKTSARKRELFLKKTARARTELFEQLRLKALSSIG